MIIFGTLMWIDEDNHSAINNKNKKIDSYFRQIKLLSTTLRATFGRDLLVFTNDKARIEAWFAGKPASPRIIEITPSIKVPSGISFFSAHYKIDALIAGMNLLQEDHDKFVLLDTDIIANHGFNDGQTAMLTKADLVVYDISDQVFPAYGASRIIRDIELVAADTFTDPRWFGGEFIAGNKLGLSRLIQKVQEVLPRYFENANDLHHKGDEMFVTASLNALLKNDAVLKIVSPNPYQLISRHWSRHTDRPLKFHMQHNFIHCPGSKPALEILSLFNKIQTRDIYLVLWIYQKAVISYQRMKHYFLLTHKFVGRFK